MVAKVWGKMGGTVGYCRDPYRVVGRGGVPLQEATHWLSYLTKPRGKGYRADYAHDFSTGRETIKPRPRRKAKIISIAGGWMPWQGRRIKGGTMTVGAFRAMRLGAVAADSWGEVGGLKAVAKILGIDPSTVRAYVKAARPGELENANAQRARKQAADRAKGLAMLRAGATHQEVADALGVSPVTPWNWAGSAPDLAAAAQEQRDARQALEDQARARLLAGESSAALVKELGLNRKVLVRLNRELGLSRKAAPPASPELIAEALAMRAAGSTVRTVGKALGIDPATVSKWAKAASQTVPVIGKADQEGGAA
jgi:predicted transcriptional regulator